MAGLVQQQLDYASGDAHRPRRRVPRWLTIVAAALGLTYVILLVIVAATDPQPARAARGLARENAYGALITGVSLAAYSALRRRDAPRARPTSFLALFSTLVAVGNPTLVDLFCGAVGIQGIGGGGDSETNSFVAGVVALTSGIVAAVRIRLSRGLMSGMALAVSGIVVGGLWVALWVALLLLFAIGMAGF